MLRRRPSAGRSTSHNFRRREWSPAVDAAGIAKPARIYDLRSTFASNALAAGITVYELARIMGTSVGMIEAHYGALLDTAHESLLERLDRTHGSCTLRFALTLPAVDVRLSPAGHRRPFDACCMIKGEGMRKTHGRTWSACCGDRCKCGIRSAERSRKGAVQHPVLVAGRREAAIVTYPSGTASVTLSYTARRDDDNVWRSVLGHGQRGGRFRSVNGLADPVTFLTLEGFTASGKSLGTVSCTY